MQTLSYPSSTTPLLELSVQYIGLTPSGVEEVHSPRREYRLTNDGAKNLSNFFHFIIPKKTEVIWLTPATIEDLLIFHAFNVDNLKAVLITTDDCRTLYGTNDDTIIEDSIASDLEVYINPKLFLQTH